MLDVYETIETFGLVEAGADLPMPTAEELRDGIVPEAFETLLGRLQGTGLQDEIEPLAHGLATVLHRRKLAVETALDRAADEIRALVRAADGSEVLEVRLDDARRAAERAGDRLHALEAMAEAAARCYEIETGRAFTPVSGDRGGPDARLTGALFEARAWIEAHEKERAERFRVEGRLLAVAGDRDWTDHARVWDVLDRCRARYRDAHAQETVLCHKGDRKGIDAIAASWARSRQVPQVVFRPNWAAFGKRAGFRAVDDMFATPKPLGGVVIFGSAGIALNLAGKAEERGIRVMRVRAG